MLPLARNLPQGSQLCVDTSKKIYASMGKLKISSLRGKKILSSSRRLDLT